MSRDRHPFHLFFVAVALILMSCGVDQLAPTEPPQASAELRRKHLEQAWLLACDPLPADSTTQTIGPAGGVIDVGPHRLVVPADALGEEVVITAVMPSDTVARLQLLPEGLTFAHRPKLELSYAHCSGAWIPVPRRVVYLDPELNIVELLESVTDIFERKVSTRLDHFSDYAVAW
jgi:hypothetical protein